MHFSLRSTSIIVAAFCDDTDDFEFFKWPRLLKQGYRSLPLSIVLVFICIRFSHYNKERWSVMTREFASALISQSSLSPERSDNGHEREPKIYYHANKPRIIIIRDQIANCLLWSTRTEQGKRHNFPLLESIKPEKRPSFLVALSLYLASWLLDHCGRLKLDLSRDTVDCELADNSLPAWLWSQRISHDKSSVQVHQQPATAWTTRLIHRAKRPWRSTTAVKKQLFSLP